MPTASRSGTRKATRQNWRNGDRSRSHPGARSRPRPNPFTELASALATLIRFHQSHPDWFPPASGGTVRPPALSPEWEAAIRKAYHNDLAGPDNSALGQNLTAEKMPCHGQETVKFCAPGQPLAKAAPIFQFSSFRPVTTLDPDSEAGIVAQTSKSAVSRVSKPAGGEMFCAPGISHDQPAWKSAIRQVWKPALRQSDDSTSEFGLKWPTLFKTIEGAAINSPGRCFPVRRCSARGNH